MAAAAAVLRIALDHLHQPEKFESYWDYLQSEWLTTSDDLRVASEREEYWNSLKLPLRLKIELVKVMENYETNVDPVDYSIEQTSWPGPTTATISTTTTTTAGETTAALATTNTTNNNTVTANTETNPGTNNDSDWELYYCEEQQAYYYYNSVTGESQWAEYDENAELIAEYNAANLAYRQQEEEGQQEGYYQERMFQRPRRLTSNRPVQNQNIIDDNNDKKNKKKKNKKDRREEEMDSLPVRHSRREQNRRKEQERRQLPREDSSDHDDDDVASEASTVNSFENDDSSSEGSVNYIITEKSNGRRFKVEAYKIKADQAEEGERDFLSAPKECFLPPPSAPPNEYEWPPQAPHSMPRRIEEKVTPSSSPVLRRTPVMDYDRTSMSGNEITSYNEAELLNMALSPSSPQVMRGYVEPPIATAEAFPLVPSELTTFDPPPRNQIATHVKPPANHSVAAGESKLHRLLRKVNIFGKPPAAPPPPSPALNEQQQRRALKEANIRTLCEMGFSRKTATYALQLAGGNLEEAMAMLLEGTDENK